MVERQDKEGAAMGEWGIFSHPAEKGRHAWTEGGESDRAEIDLKSKIAKSVLIKYMFCSLSVI